MNQEFENRLVEPGELKKNPGLNWGGLFFVVLGGLFLLMAWKT